MAEQMSERYNESGKGQRDRAGEEKHAVDGGILPPPAHGSPLLRDTGERPRSRSQSRAIIDRVHVLIVGEHKQGAPRYLEVSRYD